MRRSTVVAVMFAGAVALEVMACESPVVLRSDLAADPSALRIFWHLIEDARFGFTNFEQAAFLVRDARGTISSVPWPDAGEPNTGKWIGAFPENTVAIVHTHPNWMPMPSNIDVRTALIARVPVYVITRAHVSKTWNGSTTMVIDGEWKPGAVCAARRGGGDLAEAAPRSAAAAGRSGGARRWSWARWQRGPGRAETDYSPR